MTTPKIAVNNLKSAALTPLQWEIDCLKAIPEAPARLEVLKERKIPQAVNALSHAEQEIYVELMGKAIGVSVKAVEDILANSVDLYKEISDTYDGEAGIKKADPLRLAEHIHRWFSNGAGGRWFKTSDGKVWLFYNGHIYEIGNNLEFNTLMYRMTRLAAIAQPGTIVWYYLGTICNSKGEAIDMTSWLFTDREKDTIYLNLNSKHNKILKISPGEETQPLDNGTNEHSVLLSSSSQIKPFELQSTQGEAEGFSALKTLMMDTVPAERPHRYFLLCWTITTFLMDYQGDRGLLQVIGTSGLGKSKVAERISQLVYGENFVGRGTGASDVRIATHNPINFIDNLENRDLNQGRLDFLLLLANSATKPKAKTGSDTAVVYQRLKSMGVVTSIEPFPGKYPELLNRTFPLQLDTKHRIHGYMHDEVMREILRKRNLMLSTIFNMIGKRVLPALEARTDWSKFIHTKYPAHNKERMNEHICMMLLILEGLLEHIPYSKDGSVPLKKQAEEILERWIAEFEAQAHETAITSNTLLTLMDGLAKEVTIKMRAVANLEFGEVREFGDRKVKDYLDPEYHTNFYLSEREEELGEDGEEMFQRLDFIVTAAELYTLFNRFCANQHTRNPFETPMALAARISNEKDVLEKGGWEFISKRPDFAPKYKKVGGHWWWRFSKKIRVS
mgnify:CR=1 FL=1